LLAPDPQLICYSWNSGIAELAVAVFVHKNQPQYAILFSRIPVTVTRSVYAPQSPPGYRADRGIQAERILPALITLLYY
jgi:hypothetical protein